MTRFKEARVKDDVSCSIQRSDLAAPTSKDALLMYRQLPNTHADRLDLPAEVLADRAVEGREPATRSRLAAAISRILAGSRARRSQPCDQDSETPDRGVEWALRMMS